MAMTCITGGKECDGCMMCYESEPPDDEWISNEKRANTYLWFYETETKQTSQEI